MNFKYLIFGICFSLVVIFNLSSCNEKFKESSYTSKIGISMIDWYKKNVAILGFTECSYYPTCSQYTKQSIQKYGLIRGWIMGCDRLTRCNHDLWIYQEVKIDEKLKKYDPVL